MRTLMRGVGLSVAIAVAGALSLGACQRQGPAETETTSTPSNADREAAMAAEQLAALGGAANAQQQALYTGDFQASGGGADAQGGEESAWELQLLDNYAQFSRPGLGDDSGLPTPREYHEHGMRVVAGAITITLRQEACTASGVQLQYTANVIYEGVNYQGCARRGIDEGVRATWASVLPELIPAIDACLGRVTSRPGRVTFASTIDEGQTSVRIREANNSRSDCIVDTSNTVTIYEPVSDLDRRAGEGDPEFQRGMAPPRAQNCRTAEPANDRAGEQLGWLIHHSC